MYASMQSVHNNEPKNQTDHVKIYQIWSDWIWTAKKLFFQHMN